MPVCLPRAVICLIPGMCNDTTVLLFRTWTHYFQSLLTQRSHGWLCPDCCSAQFWPTYLTQLFNPVSHGLGDESPPPLGRNDHENEKMQTANPYDSKQFVSCNQSLCTQYIHVSPRAKPCNDHIALDKEKSSLSPSFSRLMFSVSVQCTQACGHRPSERKPILDR